MASRTRTTCLKRRGFWICDVALVVRAIQTLAIPTTATSMSWAKWKKRRAGGSLRWEVDICPDPSRAGFGGELGRILSTTRSRAHALADILVEASEAQLLYTAAAAEFLTCSLTRISHQHPETLCRETQSILKKNSRRRNNSRPGEYLRAERR
jgi:hypothetical protein